MFLSWIKLLPVMTVNACFMPSVLRRLLQCHQSQIRPHDAKTHHQHHSYTVFGLRHLVAVCCNHLLQQSNTLRIRDCLLSTSMQSCADQVDTRLAEASCFLIDTQMGLRACPECVMTVQMTKSMSFAAKRLTKHDERGRNDYPRCLLAA